MSQDNVEKILGRLLTDSEFLASCRDSLEKGCLERGFLVSELEMSAIKEIDIKQFASLAPVLDDRIIRAGNGNRKGEIK